MISLKRLTPCIIARAAIRGIAQAVRVARCELRGFHVQRIPPFDLNNIQRISWHFTNPATCYDCGIRLAALKAFGEWIAKHGKPVRE